ncbi:unnamed protein product, partial [Dovyalis caffra]
KGTHQHMNIGLENLAGTGTGTGTICWAGRLISPILMGPSRLFVGSTSQLNRERDSQYSTVGR